jgi:hypothetical protein
MNGIRTTRPLAKCAIVIAGYAAACLIANAFVNARDLRMSAQAQDSPGMYAWGDLILFLEVFGLGAILPTGLALYFLRPIQGFWIMFTIGAVAFAATGLGAALIVALTSRLVHDQTRSLANILAAIGGLREMMSPAAGVTFLLATLTAPTRRIRLALLAVTLIEGSLGLYSFFRWFAPFHVL